VCFPKFPEPSGAIQHGVPDFSRLHSVARLVTHSYERPWVEGAEHALEAGAHLFLFLGQKGLAGFPLARFENVFAS
jgi:hypothetical protein